MKSETFLFGYGLGLVLVSMMSIISHFVIDLEIGTFIAMGVIGIICLIVNFAKGGKDE